MMIDVAAHEKEPFELVEEVLRLKSHTLAADVATALQAKDTQRLSWQLLSRKVLRGKKVGQSTAPIC